VIIAERKFGGRRKILKDRKAKNSFVLLDVIVPGKIKTDDAVRMLLIG